MTHPSNHTFTEIIDTYVSLTELKLFRDYIVDMSSSKALILLLILNIE
jgi:hypothetical protein